MWSSRIILRIVGFSKRIPIPTDLASLLSVLSTYLHLKLVLWLRLVNTTAGCFQFRTLHTSKLLRGDDTFLCFRDRDRGQCYSRLKIDHAGTISFLNPALWTQCASVSIIYLHFWTLKVLHRASNVTSYFLSFNNAGAQPNARFWRPSTGFLERNAVSSL